MKAKRNKKRWAYAAIAIFLITTLSGALMLSGILRINNPSREQYPIWGVDVSEYQGSIDWHILSDEGIRFAFIKATEGSSYQDPAFAANWQGSADAGVPAGAYHFFSFESPASTQAQNLFSALQSRPDMLPPVVDIELYGKFKQTPPQADAVREQLQILLTAIEEQYGQTPILYTTQRTYRLYLQTGFEQYPLWMREVYWGAPSQNWTFWQYSDVAKLSGYAGPEKRIDLNVFAGDEAAWQTFRAENAPPAP